MRIVKFKMVFSINTDCIERTHKLKELAQAILHEGDLNILELKHFGRMSYIVFENTFTKHR